jgi:hypothetical protein
MILDSGMPAGPGLLATWVPVPDPKMKNAKARIKAAAIAINVSDAILRPRSLFGIGLSFVLSNRRRRRNEGQQAIHAARIQ